MCDIYIHTYILVCIKLEQKVKVNMLEVDYLWESLSGGNVPDFSD